MSVYIHINIFDKYKSDTSVGIFIPSGTLFRITLNNKFWMIEEKTKQLLEFILNRETHIYECNWNGNKCVINTNDFQLLYNNVQTDHNIIKSVLRIIRECMSYGRDLIYERVVKLENEIDRITTIKDILITDIIKNFNFKHSDKHLKHVKGNDFFTINGKTISHSYLMELHKIYPDFCDEMILKYSDFQPMNIENMVVKTFYYVLCKIRYKFEIYINYLHGCIQNINENPHLLYTNYSSRFLCDINKKFAYWNGEKKLCICVDDEDYINVKRSNNGKNTYIKGNQIVLFKANLTGKWNLLYDGDKDAELLDEMKIREQNREVELIVDFVSKKRHNAKSF